MALLLNFALQCSWDICLLQHGAVENGILPIFTAVESIGIALLIELGEMGTQLPKLLN